VESLSYRKKLVLSYNLTQVPMQQISLVNYDGKSKVSWWIFICKWSLL